MTNTSQKAPYGTQHPSGDAIRVEDDFFAKHGQDMYIYVQDYYPDWAYNGGQRPGDTRTYGLTDGTYASQPNGVWDYLEIVEFVADAVAEDSAHPEDYVFITFNEPDGGNWYPNWGAQKDQFLQDWQSTYEKIQEVWASHGLGHARIGGPGDTRWQPERSADILEFAKANNSLPDIFIWHELGIDNLGFYRQNFADYRALEASLGIDPIRVNITEYGMLRDMGVPGQLIQWLAMFEETKVDAQVAYWNYAGNLSDNTARPNGANAGWWMFKWYGDLEGSETVTVTPPTPNGVDTLQGIGAIDDANRRATVLWGGTDDDVTVDLSGLDTSVFGTTVDIEVREAPLTGAEGLATTPRVVHAQDGVALSGGELELTVPTLDRYAGYQLIITPAQHRDVQADAAVQPWTASIEAESMQLTSAQVYTQDPKSGGGWKFLASGGRDVGSFNRATSKADWTVEVPQTSTYRLQIIGAAPGVPGRHALFVDGAAAGTIQYTADLALNATSRWQYRGSAEVLVDLTAGSHTLSVRASANGTSVLPNSDITLDKLALTEVGAGERTTYPASGFRLSGGSSLVWGGATAGSAALATGQRADVYVTAMDSGYYDLTVDWASVGASDLQMTVNGHPAATIRAASAGVWRSTVRAHLNEGINEIEFRSASGAQVSHLISSRVRTADTASVSVEAEAAQRSGAASVSTLATNTGSNVSGGAFVGYIGAGAQNSLQIPRAAGFDTPGAYDVTIFYSNAETVGNHAYNPQVVDRRLDVLEGATQVGSGHFRYTYSWNSFWQRTIPVALTTADQPLKLANGSAYGPNVDRIVISPRVLGTPSTEEITPVTVTPMVSSDSGQSASGWHRAPATVTLTSSSGSAQAQYRVGGTGEWLAAGAPVTVSAEGVTVIEYRAFRVSSAVPGSQGQVEVKVDRSAPTTVADTDPASGTAAAGSAVTVKFTATDATSGVGHTEYSADAGATWTPATGAGVSFTAVGPHPVQYRSVDNAGNVEAAQQITVTVAEPANIAKATITSADEPTADGWYQQSVLVKLTPPSSGFKMQYRVNDGGWKNYSSSITVSANGTTKIDHRLLQANVVVAGSEGQTQVKVDKQVPTASVTRTPASGAGTPRNPIALSFAGTDVLSGLDKVEYRINSDEWATFAGDPLSLNTVGDFVVSYRATDRAGNTSAVKSTTVTIKEDVATTVKSNGKSARRGAAVTLSLAGFARWDDVTVTLAGVPVATVLTDQNGAAKVTVRVPTDAALGATQIVVAGTGASASSPLTVTD
ncbi:OmpL47-type beta-barrel domain-containing protein [Microbacterium atlanticum]|uniref:OmpL47-type beta-barrel domain-containing protein n=1 Tax=Microbacterium atlanticum TaxID=2782168 RepID=UPI001E2D6652|nr:hypothetical protein [Microbacterium atlanticum]